MSIRRTNIDRINEALKSSKLTIGKGAPSKSEGSEGDLTFRRTSDGFKLFIKANNIWHSIKAGESFDKLEKIINDLKKKVDKIKPFNQQIIDANKGFKVGNTTITTSQYDVSSGDFTLDVAGDIILDAEGDDIFFAHDGVNYGKISSGAGKSNLTFYEAGGTTTNDLFGITVTTAGATTISTFDQASDGANLTFSVDGDIKLGASDVVINSAQKLYFDGGSDTYITEHAGGDQVRLVVGGDVVITWHEGGDEGNYTSFGQNAAGFTQSDTTGPSDGSVGTVDFRRGNKQFFTFGAGNVAHLSLIFPEVSGNFVLLLKQDGTGSRVVSGNYRVYEKDETEATGSATVKFPGGLDPILTTDANHVDILSFYWDAVAQIAYGSATLDFQF